MTLLEYFVVLLIMIILFTMLMYFIVLNYIKQDIKKRRIKNEIRRLFSKNLWI